MRDTREYHLERFVDHVLDILGEISIGGLRDNAQEWEEILRIQLFCKAYSLKWTQGSERVFDNIPKRTKEMWLTLKEDDDRLEELLRGNNDAGQAIRET